MRIVKIFLVLFPCLAFCNWQTQTDDEALFLRRIADFWQEGEYLVAKAQIEEFLTCYPNSGFSDTLRSALGDLLLRERNYSEALNRYTQITVPDMARRSFLNRMQCLYHLGWYATLADSCQRALQEEGFDPQQKLQTTYFLAIGLYQQCLNAAKEPEALPKLAERAQPYFQILFESELSGEVAQAFAHLCCILKDYQKASKIILDQAKKTPEMEEELLFQGALIQAEYDKKLAISTFSEIAKGGKAKAKDAAYNCLVLSFDAGQFDELVSNKEEFLKQIPEERAGLAHLFLGRSYLALKQYSQAVEELKEYLASTANGSSEFERGALLSLLESSQHSDDLATFEQTIEKFAERYPSDPELPNAYFSRAQLLKKLGHLDRARLVLENLLNSFSDLPQKPQIYFELIQLEYQFKKWEACHERAADFLDSYGSKHELASFAWRYLITSLIELGQKEELIQKLKIAIQSETLFSEIERADWKFLLAKIYFESNQFGKAKTLLEALFQDQKSFSQEANAKLLFAFCLRDADRDLLQFCTLTEEAIEQGANLVEKGSLHAALFNAYLQRSQEEADLIHQAENHLFAAFEKGASIESQNLLWLADRYTERHPERAAAILDHCMQQASDPLFGEPLLCKRAKIHQFMGQDKEAVAILEKLIEQYGDTAIAWAFQEEAKLLLGKSLMAIGERERAVQFFDEILTSAATLRSENASTAALLRARQRVVDWQNGNDSEIQKAVVELKNLVLQRALAHEPTHLEAALDYVELQTQLDPQPENRLAKKLALLLKTKADFESTGDLLSKDYHESRAKLPEKNRIYEGYLRLIEAEIFFAQACLQQPDSRNKLQAKAKELLLQIVGDSIHPMLVERARLLLEKTDACDGSNSQLKK